MNVSAQPNTLIDLIEAGELDRFGDAFYTMAAQGGGIVKVANLGTDWVSVTPVDFSLAETDPADGHEAMRWCVLFDDIFECDSDTVVIAYVDPESGGTVMQTISGPEHDHYVAIRAVAARIGATSLQDLPVGPKWADRVRAKRAATPAPKVEEAAPMKAANDNKKPTTEAIERPTFINPADWDGLPIPRREWYVEDLIPMRQVTILNGDGGVGKSLLALQIAAAGAMSVETLGLEPFAGRTMYIGAEDEADEFNRRLADISKAHGMDLSDLYNMRVMSLADSDALLSVPDRGGNMTATRLFAGLMESIAEFGPKLVVLDTAADLFGGDEIKRGQVRQFIGMLRQLAIGVNCAVILLAHPSVQGMQSGSGSSGSTAWNNSVRSRLYLTADKDESDMRVLTTMKANYGQTGGQLRIRWRKGAFILDDGRPSPASALLEAAAERVFCDVLDALNEAGIRVASTKGVNFAPRIMAERPDAEGMKAKALEGAMNRLMVAGQIKVEWEGPPSKKRQRLVVARQEMEEAA